jgi:hypothetical protein
MKNLIRPFQQLCLLLLVAASSVGLMSCEEDNPIDPGNSGSKPVINSFSANPTMIDVGASTTLGWSVTGATSVKLDSMIDVTNQTSIELFPSETVTYTLTAKNDAGEAKSTVTVNVNNPSDPGAPANPKNLIATPGNPGIIGLSWTASPGATAYLIERRSEGQFGFIAIANVTSHTDAGLFPGAQYTYRVRALNGAGARSGWSNFAKAIAPGMAPVIKSIELVATSPKQTLRVGDTLQLFARAFDASNNDLRLAQSIFTWSSDNITAVTVTQGGLITAGTVQGAAMITASAGGKTSNTFTVNVSLQQNKTLVIYNKKWSSDQQDNWAPYTQAFAGQAVDFIYDRGANGTPTLITLEQIENYERVFYISHDDNNLHASTRSMLKLYANMDNKRLIIIGNSNMMSSDAAMLAMFGLKAEGWRNSGSINPTFTGGAGSVMEGFTFQYTAEWAYFSHMELHAATPGTAAFNATFAADDKPSVTAVQRTLPTGSKVFFAGFVLENVQQNKRAEFVTRLMGL